MAPHQTDIFFYEITYAQINQLPIFHLKAILKYHKIRVGGKSREELVSSVLTLETLAQRAKERIREYIQNPLLDIKTMEIAIPKKKRERRAKKEVEVKMIECSVCAEDVREGEIVRGKLTEGCSHDDEEGGICKGCVTRGIDSQIEDGVGWEMVKCLFCDERLGFEIIKLYASSGAFEKYDRQSVLSTFKDSPGFTWCLGPNCSSGQFHEGGDEEPIMTCKACGFKTCFTHEMPWHEGKTCDAYEEERQAKVAQGEAATRNVLARTTKVCPGKGCGFHITKNGGCDHMTCSRCRHEFCWRCLAPYNEIRRRGNSAHNEGCALHSDNLPA